MVKFVLGYDGNCLACGRVAGAIRQEIGDQVELMSLLDPRMESWREEILGSNRPWAPTLVEVQQDNHAAAAHVGLPLAINLVRVVGLRKAQAVMRAIGEDRLQGGSGLLRRRRFVQVVAGLAVGAGATVGIPRAASASTSADKLFSPFNDPEFFSSPVVRKGPMEDRLARTMIDEIVGSASGSQDIRLRRLQIDEGVDQALVFEDAKHDVALAATTFELDDGSQVHTTAMVRGDGVVLLHKKMAADSQTHNAVSHFRIENAESEGRNGPSGTLTLEEYVLDGKRMDTLASGCAGGCPRCYRCACTSYNLSCMARNCWGCSVCWVGGVKGCVACVIAICGFGTVFFCCRSSRCQYQQTTNC